MKRLYISADMEGVAGVVNVDQLVPKQFEYEKAREWMTAEVVAVCEAAFSSGIDEIVVSDSHGNAQNLLLDELPDNVQLVRSWPRPLCMMEGIQEGQYLGAILLGYHTGASDIDGVLAHSFHSRAIGEIRLNGRVASETLVSAATAAHYGVPTIMVTGDDAYVRHAQSVIEDVIGVTTKWSSSRTSSRTLTPRRARTLIAEATTAAISKCAEMTVTPIDGPIEVDLRCLNRDAAELLAYLPDVERRDSHTVRFIAHDMIGVSKLIQFLISSGSLTPN